VWQHNAAPCQAFPGAGISRGRHFPRPAFPAAGIPAAGIPASGIPASGIPASGIPAAGIPACGIPASGVAALRVCPVDCVDGHSGRCAQCRRAAAADTGAGKGARLS